ncbi:MAG: cyclic nucleotide-binding domain-containing protein [Magnetococcales bacterium]|nr:cyclic nucleotide-binding domain-containing protein [Magnetococcales bacterium]
MVYKIRKVQVATGIFLVEIPAADLTVLCACPADTVKHLIKRGLIIGTERNGVPCETGPNAILLSDELLQNGQFSNMAEFPVLQMFYRQGLILPNHPNNTGVRPLLIGSTEQVMVQMKYIFRGNYGLVSVEEMTEAGASATMAREMMRMKLRFAFGKIRGFEDLIEARMVENSPVELRNGAWIRRLAINQFEFSFADERVTVDLNLRPEQRYESPYPLGFHQVRREYFGVIHSGEGDGWDCERPCMASILMYQGKFYLIDAGPNLLGSLTALGIGVGEIEGIFHTHAHDDHFAGITTLMRGGRRIKYFSSALVRASVVRKLKALLSIREEEFHHFFEVHTLKPEVWNDLDGLEVKPVASPHPIETTIFIFRTLTGDGYRSYGHLADIVSLSVLRQMITDDPTQPGVTQDFYEQIVRRYVRPLTIKKIDIGGGMIHGDSEDFHEDRSGRILLCHTALPLTAAQREIGSSATFGSTEVLVSSHIDFVYRAALDHLRSYFAQVPEHLLFPLLNNPVVSFNPGTIILRDRETHSEIWLILTGSVEGIKVPQSHHCVITAGGLVGEISGLHNAPSTMTYRATSFVQALCIPHRIYLDFVKKNHDLEEFKQLHDRRMFLQGIAIFSEEIPAARLNALARALTSRDCAPGETVNLDWKVLRLVRSGSLEECIGDETFLAIGSGEVFGEDEALFDIPAMFGLRAVEATELFEIPGEMLRDIPIVRWKLFEQMEKRRKRLLHAHPLGLATWNWGEECVTGVRRFDRQHMRLFELGGLVIRAVERGEGGEAIARRVRDLLDSAVIHFREEEMIMRKYGVPEFKEHGKRHRELLVSMDGIARKIESGEENPDRASFAALFTNWLVTHIMVEDRKYGRFLNEVGVY